MVDAAARLMSRLGDHGLLWFLFALAGVASGARRRRRRAVTALVFTGVAAPVVNRAVKAAAGRARPTGAGGPVPWVRTPTSTSFPSGHALAAWCAATMLAEDDPRAPLFYGAAAAVSASRVHLRHHHATDVVAGSLLGLALGRVGRAVCGAGNGG